MHKLTAEACCFHVSPGRLTAEELNDPDAIALVEALRQQIAAQLGIDPSSVVITCALMQSHFLLAVRTSDRFLIDDCWLQHWTMLTSWPPLLLLLGVIQFQMA